MRIIYFAILLVGVCSVGLGIVYLRQPESTMLKVLGGIFFLAGMMMFTQAAIADELAVARRQRDKLTKALAEIAERLSSRGP